MKRFSPLLCLVAVFACACTNVPDDAVFSWGDTNSRYLRDAVPEDLSDCAFLYPAWRRERVSAEAVLWSGSGLSDVSVNV
ncbi:MAG: hypothetical protein K2O58_01495, partial [Bacteroidales bacterium]|nr:hypothetical protein [Bacteroidales bacterium]